eukprot:gene19961-26669_t
MRQRLLLLLLSAAAVAVQAAAQHVPLAVINDIAGHFEVLAGVHQVAKQLSMDPHIFYVGTPGAPMRIGLHAWLGQLEVPPTWHPMHELNDSGITADVLICVSAELAPLVCKAAVEVLRPKLLLIWVHRADTATPNGKILSLHNPFKLVALAPHVATLAESRYRQPVSWAMPIAPVNMVAPCVLSPCSSGILWDRMVAEKAERASFGKTLPGASAYQQVLHGPSINSNTVQVIVMGKGGTREDLEIPADIDKDVIYAGGLPYPAFWARMHKALALVPAFGMPVYYESRISSTILASLITGTPLIANELMLTTYTFLTEKHVFLRQQGEDEVAAMYRIHEMPEEEIVSRREALIELRKQMTEECKNLEFSPSLLKVGLRPVARSLRKPRSQGPRRSEPPSLPHPPAPAVSQSTELLCS